MAQAQVSIPPAKRIALLVEDEWLVRMEMADALMAVGWEVVEVGTGEAAIALLNGGTHFDLLITDIRLAGPMLGWEVAERFRNRDPQLAVVYASANPAIANRQVEGSVFMSKPCMMDDLVRACEAVYEARPQ